MPDDDPPFDLGINTGWIVGAGLLAWLGGPVIGIANGVTRELVYGRRPVREVLRGRRKLRPSQIDNFAMETSASALSEFKELKGIMTVVGTALPAIGLVVGGIIAAAIFAALLGMPWILFIALLMISNVPTYTWGSIRIRRGWRVFALAGVALLGAALLNEPWLTLLAISALYLAMLPFSIASYARVRRRREAGRRRRQRHGRARRGPLHHRGRPRPGRS